MGSPVAVGTSRPHHTEWPSLSGHVAHARETQDGGSPDDGSMVTHLCGLGEAQSNPHFTGRENEEGGGEVCLPRSQGESVTETDLDPDHWVWKPMGSARASGTGWVLKAGTVSKEEPGLSGEQQRLVTGERRGEGLGALPSCPAQRACFPQRWLPGSSKGRGWLAPGVSPCPPRGHGACHSFS